MVLCRSVLGIGGVVVVLSSPLLSSPLLSSRL
jgi:hypothetical protein